MAQRLPIKPLSPGTPAPAFTLRNSPYGYMSLYELLGRPVVLTFYSEDWAPVCVDQLALLRDFLPDIEASGAKVLAVSVDSPWSHRAIAEAQGLPYPLLSDNRPRGAVARAYGVLNEAEGYAERCLFVIDRFGTIACSELYPADLNPGALGILNTLRVLTGPVAGPRDAFTVSRHCNA